MTWKLRFQRFIIFLDLSKSMVKGGPDWWSQIKACWAESERVLLRRLYGKFAPVFEGIKATAKAFRRAGVTMAEAFQGMKAAVGKMVVEAKPLLILLGGKVDQMTGREMNKLRLVYILAQCSKCERREDGWRLLLFWRVLHRRKCRRKLTEILREQARLGRA